MIICFYIPKDKNKGRRRQLFLSFLPTPKGGKKRVSTGSPNGEQNGLLSGYQTGLNWVPKRVSNGYRIELLDRSLDIKRVYRKGIGYRIPLL